MELYELVVLLHPDLEIDIDKPLKKLEKIISDQDGKIAKMDNWGKRKLAYPIQKGDYKFTRQSNCRPRTKDYTFGSVCLLF